MEPFNIHPDRDPESVRTEALVSIANPMHTEFSVDAVARFIITTALSAAEVHGYALQPMRSTPPVEPQNRSDASK